MIITLWPIESRKAIEAFCDFMHLSVTFASKHLTPDCNSRARAAIRSKIYRTVIIIRYFRCCTYAGLYFGSPNVFFEFRWQALIVPNIILWPKYVVVWPTWSIFSFKNKIGSKYNLFRLQKFSTKIFKFQKFGTKLWTFKNLAPNFWNLKIWYQKSQKTHYI